MEQAARTQRCSTVKRTAKATIAAGILCVGIAAFGAVRLLGRHPVGNRRVPEPRRPVDLERYLGRWYEIARYDQRFERGCEAASADYGRRRDGTISVINRCRTSDGRFEAVKGIAKIADEKTFAKLKVSFFGPFYGDYWILDHGEDYSWSIVGDPSGRYLWILSREAKPGEQKVVDLVNRAEALGYDTSMLVFDRH